MGTINPAPVQTGYRSGSEVLATVLNAEVQCVPADNHPALASEDGYYTLLVGTGMYANGKTFTFELRFHGDTAVHLGEDDTYTQPA